MKRNLKNVLSLILAMAIAVSVLAAGMPQMAQAAAGVKVKQVKVTNVKNKKLTLKKGKSFQLKVKVKVTPNKKKYKKVKFVSSSKKIASVSSKGKIKAKKEGTAKISIISRQNKKKKMVIRVKVTGGSGKDNDPDTPSVTPGVPGVSGTPSWNPSAAPGASGMPGPSTSLEPSGAPDVSPAVPTEPSETPGQEERIFLSRKPFSESASVGDSLSNIAIRGGSILDRDGEEVPGSYQWTDPEQVMSKEGKISCEAEFVPENSEEEKITGIRIPVIVSKQRVILEAPEAGSIVAGQALKNSVLQGGSAKDAEGNPVAGTFVWTDETTVPAGTGVKVCSVTFVPEDTVKYRRTVCYVDVNVTGTAVGSTLKDKVLDISDKTWKNEESYGRAWAGNFYELTPYVEGVDLSQYERITVTVKMYDTSNKQITTSGKGSVLCKLTETTDWTMPFVEVWTTDKAALSLDKYSGGPLNLVVQNTSADIGYIEVTSITLNVKKTSNVLDGSSLKSAYGDIFGKIGVAIEGREINSKNIVDFAKSQYNSLTMGNEMKPDYILGWQPKLSDSNPSGYVDTGKFKYPYKDTKYPEIDMDAIDSYIKTAYDNGMKMRYHVFIWHAQSPQWFFKENYSTDSTSKFVSPEVMNGRLEYLIRNVMTHIYDLQDENGTYIGREVIDNWDIANEYFHNNNEGHKSYWDEVYYPEYTYSDKKHSGILTPYYIKEAFALAHSILEDYGLTDSVGLFFNEFNTYQEASKIITMINYFNTRDEINPEAEIICDGIGMQSHLDVGYPGVDGVKTRAIEKFKDAGFEIQITEIDLTDYTKNEISHANQVQMWYDLMQMFAEEKESGAKITGITWWGPGDLTSWRSSGVPLLFSEYWQAKEEYFKAIQAVSDYNTQAAG